MRPCKIALVVASLIAGAGLLTACALQPQTPKPLASTAMPTTPPGVGGTVQLPAGDVTLRSVSSTPPEDWNGSTDDTGGLVWVSLEFRNTSDTTVTVEEGFRSPPQPVALAADGSRLTIRGSRSRFEGGTGGWRLGYDGVNLGPGGVVYTSFAYELRDDQYVPGKTALRISWLPEGDKPATFVMP